MNDKLKSGASIVADTELNSDRENFTTVVAHQLYLNKLDHTGLQLCIQISSSEGCKGKRR